MFTRDEQLMQSLSTKGFYRHRNRARIQAMPHLATSSDISSIFIFICICILRIHLQLSLARSKLRERKDRKGHSFRRHSLVAAQFVRMLSCVCIVYGGTLWQAHFLPLTLFIWTVSNICTLASALFIGKLGTFTNTKTV